ncbi:hypothetical protein BH09MYX1_BH09MYX1_53340 [soil metagenome]
MPVFFARLAHAIRALAVLAPVAGISVLALHGCGTSTPSGFGTSDASTDAPDLSDSPFNFGDSSSDGGTSCSARCSSDLHTVIDCNGNVLATCPDTQGCDPSNGQCIAACDSAKANKGSVGCDFYGVAPTSGSCFAIFVANTWSSPVTLTGDYAGASLNIASIGRIPSGNGSAITYAPLPGGQIPAGQVAILFVGGSGCPIPAGNATASVSATSIGKAVHIVADRPVSAYDIFPYGGGTSAITSASLLLPTSAWNTNYVAVSPFDVSTQTSAPAGLHLVAAEDGTQITILPKKAIAAGSGVAAAAANVPKTYTINKGDQLVFMQTALLDGSPIQSTKPIGMWASMNCFNVPASVPYCDSAHQQVPPVQALGSEYALVRYRNRKAGGPEETPPWRILGLVDGTTLTWEPSTPAGAPTTLAAGQLAMFNGAGPYTFRTQDGAHPVYVSAHMTGCSTIGSINAPPDGCIGDAEYVNVVPAQEFQNSYVFFTDPTYPESDLVLVRAKAGDGTFKDVKLDCAGALTGWQPIGSGKYEYTRFDLVRGNFAKQGNCDNGRHEIKSDAPFGITVWGWGTLATGTGSGDGFYTQAVSYAYPGGMSLKPINTVVIPPTPN